MAHLDIDADELDDASDNIEALAVNTIAREEPLQEELGDDLLKLINESITETFDNIQDSEKDQDSLINAFKSTKAGTTQKVTTAQSNAPHARPLEDGVAPHYITPNDAEALSFTPEDTSPYPDRSVNPDGSVTLSKVFWTPDKNPGGWKYVLGAQKRWALTSLRLKPPQEVRRAIRESGFSRST